MRSINLYLKHRPMNYATLAYPYHSKVLRAFFVYGTDYKREIDIFRVFYSVKIVATLIVSLLIVATIILYTIRIRSKLLQNDVGSVIIDCLIPCILLVGAFFIVSVFGGDLLDSVVRVLNSIVKTFGDLANINPSNYSDSSLGFHYT